MLRFGVFGTFAAKGDDCARECRQKMQIMVAGGDGTSARVRPSLLPISRNISISRWRCQYTVDGSYQLA
ncbi:unnamed protein product [Brassica oleracea var. botrytis]